MGWSNRVQSLWGGAIRYGSCGTDDRVTWGTPAGNGLRGSGCYGDGVIAHMVGWNQKGTVLVRQSNMVWPLGAGQYGAVIVG